MAGGLRLSSLMPHKILFMWPTLVTPRSCNESTATLMPGSKPGHGHHHRLPSNSAHE